MINYKTYINALRNCAKEHENDITPFAHIRVSDLCRDTAKLLEELEQEPKRGHWYIDERPESDREVICSNCEQAVFKYHKIDFDYRPNYCPNCGADMREVGE